MLACWTQSRDSSERPMKALSLSTVRLAFALAIAAAGAGCASTGVNPSAAQAGTGYVNIYSSDTSPLFWDVKRADASGDFKTVFSELKPIEGGVLRLAFAPGRQRLRITVLN